MKKLPIIAVCLLLLFSVPPFAYSQTAVRVGTNSQVRNTIIFQNAESVPVSSGVAVSYSLSDSVLPLGNNNVHQFMGTPFSSGFRIDMGSWAFDAGSRVFLNASDTLDLDNNPRVSCEDLDIGAFEFPVRPTVITTQPFLSGRVCEGGDVLLTVEADGEPGTLAFQWQRNGENLVGRTAPTLAIPNVSMADTGYYRVIVFGLCCNDTSNVVRLDVDLRPMLVAMNDTTIVSGEDVALHVIESIGTVFWFESDMETAVLNTTITNITTSMQFFAVATNGVCADTVIAPVSIIVSGLPCRVLTHADSTICSGDPYRLLINEATVEARWFLAGTTTQLPTGSIIRPTQTTTLVLVGFNQNNEVCDTDTLVLTVPEIQLDVRADAALCVGSVILLYSTPPADQWFDGNNNPLGAGNITVTPPANATTIYTAQRTDIATGCVVRREVSITVNPPDLTLPFADFVAFRQYALTVCEGTQVHLQTNIDPAFVVWERLSDNQNLPHDPTITAMTSDVFRAHAWDPICGDVFVDLILTVQPLPTFEILPQAPICGGTTIHLTAFPNASRWQLLDGTHVSMPITPQAAQTYVGVFVSGVCEVRDTITIEVESPADFMAGPKDTTINPGESVLLWATPNATEWLIAGTSDVVANLLVSPVQTTTYVARWETAVCGTLFDTVTVNVTAPTALTLNIESDYGCHHGDGWAMVTVLDGGVEPFTFAWTNGATTALIENLNPGTYGVVVTDSLGATGSASVTIGAVTPLQITSQIIIADNEYCTNGSINVTVVGGTPPYYFEWTSLWDSTFTSYGQNLFGVPKGIYSLVVTDSRGCEQQQYIILPCRFERVMPSILLTPNDDGLNDFVYIQNIELFPINRVTIISSYGEEIITIENYNNRDRVWRGHNRRERLVPDGTYYYIVETEGAPPVAGWIIVRGSGSR